MAIDMSALPNTNTVKEQFKGLNESLDNRIQSIRDYSHQMEEKIEESKDPNSEDQEKAASEAKALANKIKETVSDTTSKATEAIADIQAGVAAGQKAVKELLAIVEMIKNPGSSLTALAKWAANVAKLFVKTAAELKLKQEDLVAAQAETAAGAAETSQKIAELQELAGKAASAASRIQ